MGVRLLLLLRRLLLLRWRLTWRLLLVWGTPLRLVGVLVIRLLALLMRDLLAKNQFQ